MFDMNQIIMYGIMLAIGFLIRHLIFSDPAKPGPFELTIWDGLHDGKRVVVSIDNDAYIFELIGKRLRITQGTTEFTENPYDGLGTLSDDVVSGGSNKSTDPGASNISDVER